MALLWADGFEHYGSGSSGATNLANVYTVEAGCTPEVTKPRTGDYSIKFTGHGYGIGRFFPSAKSTVGVGASFWFTSVNRVIGLMTFTDSNGAYQCTIQNNADGSISVVRGDLNGTELGKSSSGLITAGNWISVNVWFIASSTANATDGTVIVRVGGVNGTTLTCSNVDNLATSVLSVSAVSFLGVGLAENQNCYVDDIFANDATGSYNNTIMDAYRAYPIFPNADTAGNDFVPSSGAGYDNLNAVPPTDGTYYIQSNAVSDVSDFGLEDPSYALDDIVGIDVYSRMLTSGSGTIRVSAVDGGSVTAGSSHSLSSSGAYYHDVFERDPNGNAEWTYASVGTSKIRFTRTA